MKFSLVVPILLIILVGISSGDSSGIVSVAADHSTQTGYFYIDYEDKLLTISAIECDLKFLLHQIAEITDIEIRIDTEKSERMNFKCQNINVEGALRRLLKNHNYALIYETNKKIDTGMIEFFLSSVAIFQRSGLLPKEAKELPKLSDLTKEKTSVIETISMENMDSSVQILTGDKNSSNTFESKVFKEDINSKIEQAQKITMSVIEQFYETESQKISVKDFDMINAKTIEHLLKSK